MKTASMVLGIIGGAIEFIFSSILVVGGTISALEHDYGWYLTESEVVLYVLCIAGIIMAVLGIIGGIIVRNHNTAGGVMLIIAAVFSMFTLLGILPGIMFLIAAIFAFIKEKAPVVRAYPQQPPQPQYPQPELQQDKF